MWLMEKMTTSIETSGDRILGCLINTMGNIGSHCKRQSAHIRLMHLKRVTPDGILRCLHRYFRVDRRTNLRDRMMANRLFPHRDWEIREVEAGRQEEGRRDLPARLDLQVEVVEMEVEIGTSEKTKNRYLEGCSLVSRRDNKQSVKCFEKILRSIEFRLSL